MKIARIKFNSYAQSYDYHIPPYIGELKKGDKIVVDSPSSGYTVVTVESVIDIGKATKAVVQKIEDSEYKEFLKQKGRRDQILKELEAKAKKFADEQKYSYLSNIDPEAARLLEELKNL